jgi:hypothetical protein
MFVLAFLLAAVAWQERGVLRRMCTLRDGEAIHQELDTLPDSSEPVVVPNAHAFLELQYYGKPEIRQRLIYPASPTLDVNYLGSDTDSRLMIALSHRTAFAIEDPDEVLADHPTFLLAAMPGNYLTWRLLAAGYSVTPIHPDDPLPVLFQVEAPKAVNRARQTVAGGMQ